MGKGREVNLDQAIEEFDGVKEALAERDAAMGELRLALFFVDAES